jgi:hypothetical protein
MKHAFLPQVIWNAVVGLTEKAISNVKDSDDKISSETTFRFNSDASH